MPSEGGGVLSAAAPACTFTDRSSASSSSLSGSTKVALSAAPGKGGTTGGRERAGWRGGPRCTTLYDMKDAALTIRLDPALERQLERVARATGRSKSEVVRDALRRQLALARFDTLRRRTLPFAEARGYLTDEDVYRDVS